MATTRAARIILLGVALIIGGEAACLVGANHTACHAAFYSGIALVALGAFAHYRR